MQRISRRQRTRTAEPGEISESSYERVRLILKTLTGLRLHCYKDSCIKRRLAVRIRATGCASADEYADILLQNRSEANALIKTLTIHVSKFFRNPMTFDKIRDEIFPALFYRCLQEGRDSLNIKSVGCASGEEPYSLAIILHDSFAAERSRVRVEISATDIDQEILRIAANAVYEQDRVEDVPSAIIERYFTRNDGRYRLLPKIRTMVNFCHDDLLRSASCGEWDLILCRNVLIYFERNHQESIMRDFAGSLRTGGYLVLGKTETLSGSVRELFRTVCPIERIYQKN